MFQMCWKKCFFIFWVLLFCFSLEKSFGQTAPEITALELNKSIERKISGNVETQSYQIHLDENQYAKIVIEQTGVDVSAKLYGADGKFLASFDNEFLLKKNEPVEFVAAQQGVYKIEVKTGSKAWSGNYKIHLTELREANEKDRESLQAQIFFSQAETAKNSEKQDEALDLYKRALEIAEKFSPPDAGLIVRILNEMILTDNRKGDYAAAKILLERAAEINRKNLGAEHPQTIRTMFLYGHYYFLTSDLPKADLNYRRALADYEKVFGKNHPILFSPLMALSTVSFGLGDDEKNLAYLLQAEKIVELNYGAEHSFMAGVYNNLGSLFLKTETLDKAERYYLNTIAIFEKEGEGETSVASLTLQNLGVIYFRKKNYPKTLEYYERTLKIRERVLGAEHINVAAILNNIGGVYKALGNNKKALEIQMRVREIAEKSGGTYNVFTVNSYRINSALYAALGEIDKAVAEQKMHDEFYEKIIASNLTIGSERQKLQLSGRIRSFTSETISLHLNAARENKTALNIAALAVLQRKGRILDAVADNLNALQKRANEADRVLLERLGAVNSQIAKLTLNKPQKMTAAEYEKQIAELQDQKEKVEVEIGDRNALFPAQNPTATLEAVKAEIPENAALVEFSVYQPYDFNFKHSNEAFGEPRYIAYILRKNGDVKFVELGDKAAIDKTIGDLRNGLRDPKRKDVKQLARTADEKIMKPVRALLGDVKQIFISPDGDLNLIPFEALVDEKGKYLIESYSFDYLTSGRDLLRLKTSRTSKSESLIIANPLFGSADGAKQESVTATRNMSDTYFAPLAGTEREARAIQTLFPNSSIYTEAKATETALKEMNAPRILHIATHGFFLENTDESGSEKDSSKRGLNQTAETENPLLRSGLAFAGANRRGGDDAKTDDGILTALEASGLNLWGTKLVVLSACDTGIGDVKNGEGVYGLRRAFVLAGTETLVMSLWSVSDAATRELMAGYYKNLKNGSGRGASLRRIKLEMMKKNGREHPFYWAAFIQSGEWANLNGQR